ncbi:trichome birefringence-like protein 3 [Tanacetum coccineum]
MLDAFTSTMCVEVWGRIGYVRALIEVSADKDLKQEVTMVVSNIVGNEVSHTFETIRVEYEWKPPLCLDCHVFGHANDTCPKRVPVKVTPTVEVDNDGFTTVTNMKSKGKGPINNQKKNITGFRVSNNQNMKYQLVKLKLSEQKNNTNEPSNEIKLKNLFEKLNEITIPVTSESSGGNEEENVFGDTSKAT